MFVVGMSGTEPDYYIEKMIRERNIGGVLLFGYNLQSLSQTRSLVGSLQQLSLETEPAIPMFVAVDQEGGEVASVPWIAPQPPASVLGEQRRRSGNGATRGRCTTFTSRWAAVCGKPESTRTSRP